MGGGPLYSNWLDPGWEENSMPLNGGAVYLQGPSDGASFVGYAWNVSFVDCSFSRNAAAGEGESMLMIDCMDNWSHPPY